MQRRNQALIWAHVCGGIVFKEDLVITAAQCFEGVVETSNWRVVASEWSFSETSGKEQVRAIAEVTIHPDFDAGSLWNDIAVVRLNPPLDFGSGTIQPIALPAPLYDVPSGTNLTAAGWGDIIVGGVTSDKLRKVSVEVVADSACDAAYGGTNAVLSTMICAGVPEGGRGPCEGDAGGPLFTTQKPASLIGIASWSYRCGQVGYPTVFTEVSHYVDWINDVAAKS